MRRRTAPRYRLLLIWILLEAIAASQVYLPDGTSVLLSWLRSLSRPVCQSSEFLFEEAESLRENFRSRSGLITENFELRENNLALKTSLLLIQNQLDTLLQAHENVKLMPELGGIPARVLSRGPGMLQLIFGRGLHVQHDDPVISAKGVLGRVFRVDGNHAWVEQISNPAAAIGVQTKDGTVQGLARGAGSSGLSILYIPQHANLSIGDTLFSSGSEGIYPVGLPAARVTSISESRVPFLSIEAESLAYNSDMRALRILSFSSLGTER